MRAQFLSRALLAVVLLTAWAGGASAADSGRAGGIVKDHTGQPIKGALVTADFVDLNISSITATTDDKGRFAMMGMRSGSWTFTVQAPGFNGQLTASNVRSGGNSPPMIFALAKIFEPPIVLGSIASKNVQTSLAAADSLYASQRWDDAIAAYRTILAQAPALDAINLQIAAAFRGKKDFENAIAAYNALLAADPNSNKAKIGIAMVSAEKGDLETAEKTLELASQAQGATRDVFFGLGEVRVARSETDEAVAAYDRAAQIDPTWGKPPLALGRIAMAKGDRDAARKSFQTVVDVDPMSAEAGLAATMLQQIAK